MDFWYRQKIPTLLAECIIKLADDIALRKSISKHARQTVITKFNTGKYAKQIEAIYEEILN